MPVPEYGRVAARTVRGESRLIGKRMPDTCGHRVRYEGFSEAATTAIRCTECFGLLLKGRPAMSMIGLPLLLIPLAIYNIIRLTDARWVSLPIRFEADADVGRRGAAALSDSARHSTPHQPILTLLSLPSHPKVITQDGARPGRENTSPIICVVIVFGAAGGDF